MSGIVYQGKTDVPPQLDAEQRWIDPCMILYPRAPDLRVPPVHATSLDLFVMPPMVDHVDPPTRTPMARVPHGSEADVPYVPPTDFDFSAAPASFPYKTAFPTTHLHVAPIPTKELEGWRSVDPGIPRVERHRIPVSLDLKFTPILEGWRAIDPLALQTPGRMFYQTRETTPLPVPAQPMDDLFAQPWLRPVWAKLSQVPGDQQATALSEGWRTVNPLAAPAPRLQRFFYQDNTLVVLVREGWRSVEPWNPFIPRPILAPGFDHKLVVISLEGWQSVDPLMSPALRKQLIVHDPQGIHTAVPVVPEAWGGMGGGMIFLYQGRAAPPPPITGLPQVYADAVLWRKPPEGLIYQCGAPAPTTFQPMDDLFTQPRVFRMPMKISDRRAEPHAPKVILEAWRTYMPQMHIVPQHQRGGLAFEPRSIVLEGWRSTDPLRRNLHARLHRPTDDPTYSVIREGWRTVDPLTMRVERVRPSWQYDPTVRLVILEGWRESPPQQRVVPTHLQAFHHEPTVPDRSKGLWDVRPRITAIPMPIHYIGPDWKLVELISEGWRHVDPRHAPLPPVSYQPGTVRSREVQPMDDLSLRPWVSAIMPTLPHVYIDPNRGILIPEGWRSSLPDVRMVPRAQMPALHETPTRVFPKGWAAVDPPRFFQPRRFPVHQYDPTLRLNILFSWQGVDPLRYTAPRRITPYFFDPKVVIPTTRGWPAFIPPTFFVYPIRRVQSPEFRLVRILEGWRSLDTVRAFPVVLRIPGVWSMPGRLIAPPPPIIPTEPPLPTGPTTDIAMDLVESIELTMDVQESIDIIMVVS